MLRASAASIALLSRQSRARDINKKTLHAEELTQQEEEYNAANAITQASECVDLHLSCLRGAVLITPQLPQL